MKTIAKLLVVVAIALTAAACDPKTFFSNVGSVFTMSTASINNPVTPTMLYEIENGAIIAFAGLNAYKRSCVAGTVPDSCRGIIKQMQVYTRKLKPIAGNSKVGLLADLRRFVTTNDQVNAVIAYNAIQGIIADFRNVATANNIAIGGN